MARILIVDDDENISALYEEDLREEDYEVAVASNGKESIEMLKTFTPDIIVMDIRMPEMDGIEALGKIIAMHKNIPIILNSAYSSYKDDFRSWGADAYVVKSSDTGVLKEKIKEILGRADREK
ncbi:MAG: response regulator [Deltaproteobacteria bacterium]|nr:response regulator [Candidatus Zymogenaceae bacterium]